jgi:nitroimidazol reductase NimA-like FMN-containing flavoprotein (pyridoxamine 5'-phosphate oxidase superfamily)
LTGAPSRTGRASPPDARTTSPLPVLRELATERQQSRPADQIRVRRNPKNGRYERETINSILDRGLVAHVALVDHGEPVCVPMLYARISRKLYIHGARSSRMIKLLAAGQQACLAVTLMQGLVLARSAFEHSANYESVVAFGRFEPIDETAERLAALAAFTDKLLPGRFAEVRPPSATEMKATAVLAMPIEHASAKVRYGPPDDDDTEDATLDVWAGEIPILTSWGEPVASPGLRAGIPPPASLRAVEAARA